MSKVIVLTNQKGGCGKTTTAIHLASGLANLNYKILVIDADPQHTARNWADGKEKRFKFEINILENSQRVDRLINLKNNFYDFIIIDCPPSVNSIVTYSSLLVSDIAIIPLLCSANDLWALTKIVQTIKEAKNHNPNLKERILINQYRPKEKLTTGIIEAVQNFMIPILSSKLGSRIAFKESAAYGTTVYQLKDKKAIDEVESLTKEIEDLING
jgi:chromosome partitioning protein